MLTFDKISALKPSVEDVLQAASQYAGFLVILAALCFVVPGRKHLGTPLKDGSRLTYSLNGFNTLLTILAFWFANVYHLHWFSASFIVENFAGFFVSANLWALLLSVVLFIKGAGSSVKSFVVGTELNPRLLGLDMKMYALRPAMMGWVLLNLSFLAKHQQLNHGAVELPILLAVGFQIFYVLDYFWFEEFMTSTWDIVAEHFGYMLIFGALPIAYCSIRKFGVPFCFIVSNS
eukprot:TRINITY_DN6380_c0_g1_i1.p1 TRINITY_DN6380_c0_g1~~TRINITY_DN6380_c0_g1_i1.p1  ORF type:complete len:247 (-),score=22.03 TRINITY_DN6380_c0_g1_i1:131-829(-)